jgi:hypothetical protein
VGAESRQGQPGFSGNSQTLTGFKELGLVFRWLTSFQLIQFLKSTAMIRFYAIAALFFCFVYLNISRIDFFLCGILFLAVFISMFYFDDDALLKKLLYFYLAGSIGFMVVFFAKIPAKSADVLNYPSDWLCLVFILSYFIYAWMLIRNTSLLRKKFRMVLILAVVPPFVIGTIFKYLLLVPMPKEGL